MVVVVEVVVVAAVAVSPALHGPSWATVWQPLGTASPAAGWRKWPTQVPLCPPPGNNRLHAPARPPQSTSVSQVFHAVAVAAQ